MSNQIKFNDVTYFVVTGASRGIGQTIAIESSKQLKSGSIVLLLARSLAGLEQTKIQIESVNPNISVIIKSIDLSDPSELDLINIFESSLGNLSKNEFKLACIIHNVGTIGDLSKCAKEVVNYQWKSYFKINLFSVITLNNLFMKFFENNKKFIVNITSKCGIVPYVGFAQYCAGKAAREMYFRVLAAEEESSTDNANRTIVLNYSPGPVDTDMTVDVQENSFSTELRNMFSGMRDGGTILQPIQTTLKFLEIVRNGEYKSGDHVDYFD